MNNNTTPEPISKTQQNREIRRQQILDATVKCVRKSGFHGASMADIAHEAGLSVGVIYRYFANKEAIIEALVANDLAQMRAKFAEWDMTPDEALLDTILDTIEYALDHKFNADNSALALEVLAEAARNPNVANIVQNADIQERELSRNLCERLAGCPCNTGRLTARGEIISMIFDGMMSRFIANPNIDREALLPVLREVMTFLFTLPDPQPSKS
ncbi:MAG: TetR/AcrR family transcriptional regulator [Asticcacaulis sp.]